MGGRWLPVVDGSLCEEFERAGVELQVECVRGGRGVRCVRRRIVCRGAYLYLPEGGGSGAGLGRLEYRLEKIVE